MLNNPTAIIKSRVEGDFVTGRYNCSMTALTVLAEIFEIPIAEQTIDAAQAMPGAGGVGDLCGFVSGGLMFIGVWAGFHHFSRGDIRQMSQRYSQTILEKFGSLHCCDLRNDCASLAVHLLESSIPIFMEEMKKLNTS